ncbi:serine hydrolase [Sphingobium sp. RSMS]|uniref:serine hydrolase n=1 Tax=Sphingobium sp. RSMS TaxID=520734 RepID=UPI0010F8A18F|nr:serine hydrolase [Sphingobium sp. RSMS]UXC89668.1 serine hydrolase [Sphingobium sp. RSMS]
MTNFKGGRGKRPNGGGNSGSARLVLLMAALSACVSAPQQPYAAVQQRPQPSTATFPIKPVANPPKPFEALKVDQRETPPPALVSVIRNLGQSFNGKVGIAVRRIGSDWTVAWNGNLLFPQQSVSKLWVSMTFLDAVDRGKIRLSDSTTITKKDLTLFHQPTAALVGNSGWTTTYSDLMRRAMTQSDNTANDTLLRAVGGPEAVRSYLARRYIRDIRFGPGERLLQSTTAGLEWRQDYSIGRNFYAARAKLPLSVRQKALDNYLASPPDGAAPSSIVQALAKLKQNDMLSPASSQLLLSIMGEAKTGPQRIKGGVPPGWHYLHKTGTGQELGARSTGFNDIGIMTAPDGTSYAVAVMIGSTTEPIPTRWQLMQAVAKAVAANHEAR